MTHNIKTWQDLIHKHSSQPQETDYKEQPLLSISKFVNNQMLNNNYRNKSLFYEYYQTSDQSLKLELLQNSSYSFTESEYEIILQQAKYISQNISPAKWTAKRNSTSNRNISKGDALSIQHIICLLIYIHFPFYVQSFQASFSDMVHHEKDFSIFGGFLYGSIAYFGERMPQSMKVYHALGTEKPKMFDFFNSAFIVQPLSCTSNLDNLVIQSCKQVNENDVKEEDNIFNHFIILELQSQFIGDFNDTLFLDVSDFSSYGNEGEILFWGEWAELSITDIIIVEQKSQQALYLYTEWMKGMKYFQKLTSGFADYNVRKFNLGHELNENTMLHMCRIIRKEKDVPLYISDLFTFYVESKTGVSYHKMYKMQLDIDFGKIVKKAFKHMNEETRLLLFNEEVTDIDVEKMKLIFVNGRKYRNNMQNTCMFEVNI